MAENRRTTDRWICKRLYEMGTPWVQVIGFVTLCIFWGTTYFDKFQAYGETLDRHQSALIQQRKDIDSLQQNYAVIDQKLDDIKAYLLKK